ncbi:MAG TPA: hypothetical protein ENJ18_07795 [Nannocystis exedens]|nr:hypothetical protein [Nannocystis exedens]
MRTFGHILMWAGVLATSFVSVFHVAEITWAAYGAAMAMGLAGIVLLRLTAKSALLQEHQVNEDLATMHAALSVVVRCLEVLVSDGEEVDVYGVKDRIDEDMVESMARFADARESMIPAFGLEEYAEVMTRFAGGERLLNRAWSASADGYLDEVVRCLQDSLGQLREAKTRYEHLQGALSQTP